MKIRELSFNKGNTKILYQIFIEGNKVHPKRNYIGKERN